MGLPGGPGQADMARARLALGSGLVTFEQVDALMAESHGSTIAASPHRREHRYFHVVGKHAPVVGEWDHLRRYDTLTGSITTRDLGARRLGEAIFAPGGSGTGEDDGYLLVYTYDPAELTTDLLILHAGDVAGEPAATLRMPHRVPFGLHGNWVAVP